MIISNDSKYTRIINEKINLRKRAIVGLRSKHFPVKAFFMFVIVIAQNIRIRKVTYYYIMLQLHAD